MSDPDRFDEIDLWLHPERTSPDRIQDDPLAGDPLPAPPPPEAPDAERADPSADPSAGSRDFDLGTGDDRYVAVGVRRRLVLGGALALVSLVLLLLLLLTGPSTPSASDGAESPAPRAADPEFIDRDPVGPPPAFADPPPFAYSPPPQPVVTPSSPAYTPGTYTTAPVYDAPPPVQLAAQPAPEPLDPRREAYEAATASPLMVDPSGRELSVGGQTAAAGASGAGPYAVPAAAAPASAAQAARTPDQQAAFDALSPDIQAAVEETRLMMQALGIDPNTTTAPGTSPGAAMSPAASAAVTPVSVPEADGVPASGTSTCEAFLDRTRRPSSSSEPFRVEMSPRSAAPRSVAPRSASSAPVRPLVRRTTDERGPSAEDPPLGDVPSFSVAPGSFTEVLAPEAVVPEAVDSNAADSEAVAPEAVTTDLRLLPGTVIPAVLVTGMNSELPGDVVAQVERHVYDSATMRHVLVPQGTRFVGTYDDQIAYGQGRALVAWTRMVYPDGRVVVLPGLPGHDLQGAAGLADRVDRHLDRVFGAAVALAAVGTGLALATPDRDGVDLSPQSVAGAQVAIELSRVATEVLRRELDVEPTVTVRPGYRLTIFLARAMEFDRPYVAAPSPGRFERFSRGRR